MKEIALPPPSQEGALSLEKVIATRRSVRSFAASELTLSEIGQLLWAAQGITGSHDNRRAAPSAGACCPLECYACHADGVWRYVPHGHLLAPHKARDVRQELAAAAWRQSFIGDAPLVVAVAAIPERTTDRYGERGRTRYVNMDLGHAAQNLLLQAVALGLASVPVGAFADDAVARALSLPTAQVPLYLLPVGHPLV